MAEEIPFKTDRIVLTMCPGQDVPAALLRAIQGAVSDGVLVANIQSGPMEVALPSWVWQDVPLPTSYDWAERERELYRAALRK